MSSAKRLIFSNVSSSYINWLAIFVPLISLFHYTASENCIYKTPCECQYQNGSVIDLSSLGYRSKARWENVVPIENETYTYYYNPCYPFRLGPDGNECAKGVAVCQVSKDGKDYFDCGDQDHMHFAWNKLTDSLHLIYTAPPRTTNITLVCSVDAFEPILEVKGESSFKREYEMTLISRCACPDLCRKDHLSAGSVLVIIFMIFISLYLVLGIIHSSLTRGAHGWELLPHYEFWVDFPLLVRDGCVFVINGCKPETGYERI